MKVHKSSKGYEYIVPTATVVLPILLALPVQYSLPSHYRCYSYYQPQPPPTWSSRTAGKAWLIAQWRLQIPDWTCSISFCSGSLPVCIGLFQRGQHPPQVQDVGFQRPAWVSAQPLPTKKAVLKSPSVARKPSPLKELVPSCDVYLSKTCHKPVEIFEKFCFNI